MDDLPNVLKKQVLSGMILSGQEKEIGEMVKKVITSPQLKKYFSKKVISYQEREIIFEGKIYRPDRIVENEGSLIIIDFKTGKKLPQHRKQIELYEQTFLALGKKIESKMLVYINDQSIELITI